MPLFKGEIRASLRSGGQSHLCCHWFEMHLARQRPMGGEKRRNPALELALICEVLTPEGTDAFDLLAKLRLEQGDSLVQVE